MGAKTKTMFCNFTKNHEFTTTLEMNGDQFESIDGTRLFGTDISNNHSWNENAQQLLENQISDWNY